MGITRLRCYLGRHTRSRGRARRTDYGWHSYCRGCGVEMIKQEGGDWTVVESPAPLAPDPTGGAVVYETEAGAVRSRFARWFRRKR